jgi:hypothetical protein
VSKIRAEIGARFGTPLGEPLRATRRTLEAAAPCDLPSNLFKPYRRIRNGVCAADERDTRQ